MRISRLHELSIDEKILREREQRERKVAFSRRRRKSTSKELLEALELEDLLEKWPKDVLKCGEVIGNVTKEAFEELFGESAKKFIEIPVVQGGADAFIGMIGLGAIHPKTMALITGSSHYT